MNSYLKIKGIYTLVLIFFIIINFNLKYMKSGNKIENDGAKQITKVIINLDQLTSLNLNMR